MGVGRDVEWREEAESGKGELEGEEDGLKHKL